MLNMHALDNGYVYIYVSNESATDVDFDNLRIFHHPGNYMEENHYYPFGMVMEGLSTEGEDAANTYKYQDNELQTKFDYNVEEFALRHYDPAIARWTMHDPVTQFANPYIGMGNNPVRQVDPMGSLTNGSGLGIGGGIHDGGYLYHYMGATFLGGGRIDAGDCAHFGPSGQMGWQGGVGADNFVDASGASYSNDDLIKMSQFLNDSHQAAHDNQLYSWARSLHIEKANDDEPELVSPQFHDPSLTASLEPIEPSGVSRLSPLSFQFEKRGENWQIAAVTNLTLTADVYRQTPFGFEKVEDEYANFNIQVGVPVELDNNKIISPSVAAVACAAAADIASGLMAQEYSVRYYDMSFRVQIPTQFAAIMQDYLNSAIAGCRVTPAIYDETIKPTPAMLVH